LVALLFAAYAIQIDELVGGNGKSCDAEEKAQHIGWTLAVFAAAECLVVILLPTMQLFWRNIEVGVLLRILGLCTHFTRSCIHDRHGSISSAPEV